MKSIKEKSKEWCSGHSNKCCKEKCDGCWQLKQAWGCEQHNMELAYEAGANYVLEEIEIITKADLGSYKSQLDRIKKVIEQLKK